MLVNIGERSGNELLPISRLIKQRIRGQKIKYFFCCCCSFFVLLVESEEVPLWEKNVSIEKVFKLANFAT